jgi:MFS family permease
MIRLSNNAQHFYGWKLVGALWLLDFLNMGFPLYGGTIINTYMLKDIQMSRSAFGLAVSLLNLAAGVPSVLIAAVIVRFGIRAAFGIGSALLVFGSLWMAFVASQPWHYMFGFGIVIGSGIGFGTIVPLSTALARWFKLYRGRAMALAMTASGVAGFIGAPAINRLLEVNGGNWRQAWLVVAGIALLSGAIAYLFIKERPEDLGQSVDGLSGHDTDLRQNRGSEISTPYAWTPAEAYRTLPYWLLFAGSVACQFPFFFLMAHWVLHLKGIGITAANAAFAMGMLTLGGIGGRLIGGWLMDKIPARFVFILGFVCNIFGCFLALSADEPLAAYIAAILLGTAFGGTFVALNAAIANFYGPAAFPRLMGMMLLISAVACSPAGLLGGRIFDLYKSYTPAFALLIAICVAAVVALSFARMPQSKTAANCRNSTK